MNASDEKFASGRIGTLQLELSDQNLTLHFKLSAALPLGCPLNVSKMRPGRLSRRNRA